MKKTIRLLLSLTLATCALAFNSHAQTNTYYGRVQDSLGQPLRRATVQLLPKANANPLTTVTDSLGRFNFTNITSGNYTLAISFTGYKDYRKALETATGVINLGVLVLYPTQEATIGGVTVQGRAAPARQKGDTTEISAAALKANRDATAEDLIKKAPGITVDANGTVTAQGEQVRRVTIDGRQFFGDDATAALRNLPAEVIDKIQVFDRLSDQAQLTGISDGSETKALNIVTKANMRNGQFGRLYAGYGTDERYAAGGSVNIFKGNKRVNLVALLNNVNQQNFSGEDLLGVSGAANQGRGGGGSGGRGSWGGGGGGRPGSQGGGNNFQVGQQAGIAQTNALGVNFSDLWANKKIDFSGSYFYNNSTTVASNQTSRQQFLGGDTSQFYNETNRSTTTNANHRINMRMEYKIDSNNTLIVSPSLSFQQNKGQTTLDGANTTAIKNFINSTLNATNRNSDGYNLRNELTYRRAFNAKRGRSFSVNLNTGLNRRQSNTQLDAFSASIKSNNLLLDTLQQKTDADNSGYNLSTNVTYNEPIGKTGQLQVNYNPQFTKSEADQRNLRFDKSKGDYTIFDTTQSNLFENTVTAQNGGLNYRVGDYNNQWSVGINYQNTQLKSTQTFPLQAFVNKRFSNWLPNVSWRRTFNRQSNLRVNYRASVNAPSVNQLQNVINIRNPLFVTTGNAELEQSYTHFAFARYSYTDAVKGRSFFAGIFAQQVDQFVTNATFLTASDSLIGQNITLRKGAQLSKPVNLNGYYSVRTFITYGMPLKPIKTNLNLTLGYNFVRTPGLVNNITNLSTNNTYTLGATFASNISEYIDFNLSYAGNFNQVTNSIQNQLNNRFYFHTIGFRINTLSKSGWFILNEVNNTAFSGLADGFNQNYFLWNLSGGKKFLKNQRGEVKLTIFDLLKQNQSIVRNVGDTYVEDVQTQVLQQYFMLTFTYTLRNFGKPAAQNRTFGGRER
ncbi:MAG: hypothetical protein EAY75_15995 [Bacteroidetes bacterium]|nr:MAG: hypothetical protein EAY75_15995 [Bacteroidota bacterium]